MREGWTSSTLADLCELIKGTSPTQKTPAGQYPLIVTASKPASSEAFQIEGEAVCVPLVSSTGHGHASIKRVHYASGRFAVANIMAAIVVKDATKCDTRFLWMLLQHRKDELIVPKMKGTANVSLSVRALGSVVVALPPLAEQRRIVDLIGAVDVAIAGARASIVAAMTARTRVRRAFFEAELNATRYVPLSELATTRLGKMLSATTMTDDKAAPYLRNADVQWGRVNTTDLKLMPFSPSERVEFSLKEGDVLICEGGAGVGSTAVLDRELPGVYYQKALHRVRCGEHLSPHFFALWMEEQMASGYIHRISKATGIPHFTGEKLRRMPVPIVQMTDQIELVERCTVFATATSAAGDLLESYSALRAELLSSLLLGAHEVPAQYDRFLMFPSSSSAA
ncbi:MAG: restriction modification system specificity domain [Microbacteriaceae bacterium]|nr:restriction modification system specificity domain [Microbacteriaceae bacterium]